MTILELKYQPLNSLSVVSEFTDKKSATDQQGSPIIASRQGIDLMAQQPEKLFNAHDGEVIFAGMSPSYGNVIVIQDNESKYSTLYAHLSEISVSKGDNLIERGLIGKTGNTGPSGTRSHLHVEIIDPDVSEQIKNLADLETVKGQGRSINPRQLFAAAFLDTFPTMVDSKSRVYDLEGDSRSNHMIGNSLPNSLEGFGGFDIYHAGFGDKITDVDGDGMIVIQDSDTKTSYPLSGNAAAYVGSADSWSLKGFELSKSGNDLIISKEGNSSEAITIANYPFDEDRAFGISLGKVPAVVYGADGQQAHDFDGNPIFEYVGQRKEMNCEENIFVTSDRRGRGAVVTYKHVGDPSGSYAYWTEWNLSILDSKGNVIDNLPLPGDSLKCFKTENNAGENIRTYVFQTFHHAPGEPENNIVGLGAVKIDFENLKILAQSYIPSAFGGTNTYPDSIYKYEGDYAFVYTNQDNVPTLQKFDVESLNLIDGPIENFPETLEALPAPVFPSRFGDRTLAVFPDGNKLDQTGRTIDVLELKMRDPLPNEIAPSARLLAPGDYAESNPNEVAQLISFNRTQNGEAGAIFRVKATPGLIGISGLENSGATLDLSEFGLTTEQIATSVQLIPESKLSFDNLGQESSSNSRRKLQTIGNDDFDDSTTAATPVGAMPNAVLTLPTPIEDKNVTIFFFNSPDLSVVNHITTDGLAPTPQPTARSEQPTINPTPSSIAPTIATTQHPSTLQPTDTQQPTPAPSTTTPTDASKAPSLQPVEVPSPSPTIRVTYEPTTQPFLIISESPTGKVILTPMPSPMATNESSSAPTPGQSLVPTPFSTNGTTSPTPPTPVPTASIKSSSAPTPDQSLAPTPLSTNGTSSIPPTLPPSPPENNNSSKGLFGLNTTEAFLVGGGSVLGVVAFALATRHFIRRSQPNRAQVYASASDVEQPTATAGAVVAYPVADVTTKYTGI